MRLGTQMVVLEGLFDLICLVLTDGDSKGVRQLVITIAGQAAINESVELIQKSRIGEVAPGL